MFKRITQRFRDMKALSALMHSAEQHSRKRSQGDKPSAEHFVLAAIDSEDGDARQVFKRLGLDATDFDGALREQYKNTLNAIGIDVDDDTLQTSENASQPESRIYTATESGTELLRNMAQQKTVNAFSSADVLRAIDSVPTGPAHRAFIIMGTSAEEITVAANSYAEQRYKTSHP